MDRWLIGLFLVCIALAALYFIMPHESRDGKTDVRIGFFPNILHAQALIGRGNDSFQNSLGNKTHVTMVAFNAGPSVIEAMFANQIDIAYIGPNPTVNGYVKSNGDALRVIAGAASGGAVFVVRNDSNITKPGDLAGKRIASPQLGNTQDVALRDYIIRNGLKIGDDEGEVQVIPTANPDILALFQKKEIDGAWVPEPWGARLVQEGGGRIFLDERSLWPQGRFVTANIIVSRRFLEKHPELVKRFLITHVELTEWIDAHPEEAKTLMNSQIKNLTTKELPPKILDEAFARCEITYDPIKSSLIESAQGAYELGFLGDKKPDLSGLYDLTILNEVLREKGLKEQG